MTVAPALRKRAASGEPRLSAGALQEMLDLLQGASSLELKLTVPDQSQGAAIRGLGFDPVEAEPRQTFFFDTPDLALNRAGLIVRARRRPGGKADTVVKLRPVDPKALDAALLRDPAFKIELDALPGGYVCSASCKGSCTAQEVIEAADGRSPLQFLFSKLQRAFYAEHAPPGLAMKALVPLGPTFLLRLKQTPKDFDRAVVVELWLYPDGSRVLEISTKGEPREAFEVAARFRAFLARCGIAVEKQGGSKTAGALKFFTRRLSAAA
ncbi:MAG: hypothetical protein ACJ8DZ_12000 [Allosphingosinicella sp.]